MRAVENSTDGRRCGGRPRHDFTRYSKHGLQVVVRRRDFVDGAELARGGELRQARVEHVGPRGLHDDRLVFEPQAEHVVVREELARQHARAIGLDATRCAGARRSDRESGARRLRPRSRPWLISRMFDVIDSISCRMWLETMMLLPCAAPLLDQADRLAPQNRIHPGKRLVEDEQLRIVHDRLRHLDALTHPLAVRADLLAAGIRQVHVLERPAREPLGLVARRHRSGARAP